MITVSFKKNLIKAASVLTAGMLALTIAGCSETTVPDSHSISIDFEGKTGAGIGKGSTYDEWIAAYTGCSIQKAGEDGFEPYTAEVPADEESAEAVDHDGIYMISAFYVDDEPVPVSTLVSETGISADELNDHLAGSDYLKDHTVVYRYALFTIENDIVTSIDGDFLDYNKELN